MKLFLLTVNKCKIAITITIILMSKVFWKDIFSGFQLTVFKNKRSFMKKTVLHTATLMHCRARQVLHDLFSTNQSKMTFVAGATKINFENLKT